MKTGAPAALHEYAQAAAGLFSSLSSSLIFEAAVSETLIMSALYKNPVVYCTAPHCPTCRFRDFPAKN